MVRALLFDFNGVLVADEAIHIELLAEVLRGHGVEPPADHARRFLGRPDRDCLREAFVVAQQPLDDATLYRLLARKATAYRERIQREGYPLVPAALALLSTAAAAHRAIGVVSGALRSEIELALKQAGVRDVVKVIVAAEDVRQGKPSPDGYLRGIDLLNALPPLPDRLLHPHEVVAIEDSPAGLRAAREAGLTTLAVAGSVPPEELAEADLVVPALAAELLPRLDDLVGAT